MGKAIFENPSDPKMDPGKPSKSSSLQNLLKGQNHRKGEVLEISDYTIGTLKI